MLSTDQAGGTGCLTGPAATTSSFKSSVLSLKEKLKAFQERLVEERKKRLEERKKQRKEDRRNTYYRQKEEEAQRIHEEQLKKGNLCWHMCSGKRKAKLVLMKEGQDAGGRFLIGSCKDISITGRD